MKDSAATSLVVSEQIISLPERYKAASSALAQCNEIDELAEIKNKHVALAAYAQQAKDKELLFYAKRIQLRAYERIGEILAAIEDPEERKRLAATNQVSAVIARRAFEAAHIPKRVRDQLIDSSPPPSLTRMADAGSGYMPKRQYTRFNDHAYRERKIKKPPEDCAEEMLSYVRALSTDFSDLQNDGVGGRYTMAQIARAIDPSDLNRYRTSFAPLISALKEFSQHLR